MEFRRPHPAIVHVVFKNQRTLCREFLRLSEFSESPYPAIRNRRFSLEEFKRLYAKDHGGRFTYYTDWTGMNISGGIVRDFFRMFPDSALTPVERRIKKYLMKHGFMKNRKMFSLIGTCMTVPSAYPHEVAHSLWLISGSYRYKTVRLIDQLPSKFRKKMMRWLKKIGYSDRVIYNEIQAYMSEADLNYLSKELGMAKHKLPLDFIGKFTALRELFLEKCDVVA